MARINNSYYAILGILSIGPMSGYQINHWVKVAIGYFWDIDYKQIYPTLKRLVHEGSATFEVVKSEKRPESKVYMLTDKGMKEFLDWLVKPIQEGKHSKSELMLKLFFGHHVPIEINLGHLQKYKTSSLKTIQDLKEIKERLETKPEEDKDAFWHYRMTTIDRGILIHQADVDWCNQTEDYLYKNINGLLP